MLCHFFTGESQKLSLPGMIITDYKLNFKGTDHNLPTSNIFLLKMPDIHLAYDEKDLKFPSWSSRLLIGMTGILSPKESRLAETEL